MKIDIDTVKGFQDFLPPESLKRKKIKEIIEQTFRLYGFLPLETPVVEYDELMRSDTLPSEQEDEAISDRFRLRDKGGRNLGLRYEFTFQLSRILKQNPNIKMPFKRYQIGSVFRDEPVSSGRFRQFTQCDADIIGSSNIESDAECLALVSDILKALKIDFEIEINNRLLLKSIIDSVQISNPRAVIKELDKMDKIGEDEVKINLKKYATANQIITLLKILEKPIDFFEENSFEGISDLLKLKESVKPYGLKLKFNPYLARGLGYYTGNIFEVKTKESKNTIAAGGRYDNTVGKYSGKETPAVGISFGLERISQLAELEIDPQSTCVLISIEEPIACKKLAQKLRKQNISCITFFGQPGKQLDFANSQKIPYAVFIGPDEVNNKKFKLRDLETGEEKTLTEKQLIKKLS